MPKQIFDEETMTVKLCKDCKGLGYYPSDCGWVKCASCEGSGRVIIEKHDLEHRFSDFDFPNNQLNMPFDK